MDHKYPADALKSLSRLQAYELRGFFFSSFFARRGRVSWARMGRAAGERRGEIYEAWRSGPCQRYLVERLELRCYWMAVLDPTRQLEVSASEKKKNQTWFKPVFLGWITRGKTTATAWLVFMLCQRAQIISMIWQKQKREFKGSQHYI